MPKLGDVNPETGLIFWSKNHGWLTKAMFDRYKATYKRCRERFKNSRPCYWREQEERHREKNRKKRSMYYEKNKDLVKMRAIEWAKKNPEKKREINRRRYSKRLRSDPTFALRVKLGNRIACAVRRGSPNPKRHTMELIGCSGLELKIHIESLWLDGMNWSNWSPSGWHIDHVIPLASAKTDDEMIALCHYTNLQPLWAVDNIKKWKNMPNPQAIEKQIAALREREMIQKSAQEAVKQAQAQAASIVEQESLAMPQ